jgi:hypothetical protein
VCAETSHSEGVAHICTEFHAVWFELHTSRVAPLHWYWPGEHGACVHWCEVALQSAALLQLLIVTYPVCPALHC